jgi:hypothetical protein
LAGVRLQRLLRRPPVAALLRAGWRVGPGAVIGPAGEVLLGAEGADALSADAGGDVPVELDGEPLGDVRGARAPVLGAALAAVAGVESERRATADEVLELYKEVNLLAELGATLAPATDRAELIARSMTATMRLVPAERMVVYIDDGSGGPRPVAAVPAGAEVPTPTDLARARIEPEGTGAVLIGPLAIGDAVRGAVVLARPAATFTAGELKVLVAILAQVAPHVERVLAVERRERDAAEREERLRLEIAELRTELAERQRDAAHGAGDPGESEYFTDLRARAARLRDIVDG